MGPDTEVIGVGNPWRSDDGVGPYVVEALASTLPARRLHTVGTNLSELLTLFEHCRDVLLIDALDGAAAGLEPGTVLCLSKNDDRLAYCGATASSHALGVVEALGLAESLDVLPPRVEVIAIAGVAFAHGLGLSPEVRLAADELVGTLTAGCAARRHAGP